MKNKPLKLNRTTLIVGTSSLTEDPTYTDKTGIVEPYGVGDLVYDDLVFTLSHNQKKYFRPFVRPHEGRLLVVGNKPFFMAAREAGLENIYADLLFQEDEFEDVLDQFNVTAPGEEVKKEYDRYFFFEGGLPRDINIDRTLLSTLENLAIYPEQNCLNVKFDTSGRGRQVVRDEEAFLRKLAFPNKLRSIDGIRKKGSYKDYISTQ